MSDSVTRVMLATRLDTGVQLNDTYEIDERIASGGMGEVYRGHNIQTGEPVAIKTILPELAEQEAISSLFKREATVLGRLHHDTIVRYYSYSRDPRLGRPYLAMEFVEGVSLADRMKSMPLTPDEVCRLFPGVAEGLALAHGAGVIHRDLSPDNIILRAGDVGRPKLIDFGIARSANFGEGTLIGGGFAGKFNFVSPEQLGIRNREVDGRSDIYSLGLVIAAALRGRPIEMGGSHVEVIEKRTTVPDLSDIDESLRPLIEAMLQPNPDDRPADMAMVAEWLRAARSEAQRTAPPNGGLAVPPATPGAGFPTQSGIWATSPGMKSGTPFSSADPTQLVSNTSAPTPFPALRPAAASGESPFGSAAAYPAAPLAAPPTGSLPGDTTPAKKKSGAARYAIAAVLVLLVLGTGGAYMAGLIPPLTDGSPTETADTETQVVTTEPTSTEPTSIGPTTKPTAKSPEHEAIGVALEDFAKGEQTTTPTVTQPVTTPETKTATGPITGPSTDPSDPATETEKIALAPTGPEDLTPPDTSDQTSKDTTGPTISTGPSVDDSEEATKQATAGLAKMVDIGVTWLRDYDGGKCFFVAVTSVSDETINVKGFGPDSASFEKLYNSFMQTHNIEPELNGHLISQAQCAAAEFLKSVQPGAKQHPELRLTADKLKATEQLVAIVGNTGDKALDLLLVHGDGLVYNIKALAEETEAGSTRTFRMNFKEQLVESELPEIVIAITSPSGLAVPEGKQHARAAALFPKLARQIEQLGGEVGVDFAYFRVGP